MCGWQVKLCDPLVTHWPYPSTLEIRSLYIKRYINSAVYIYLPAILAYFTFKIIQNTNMYSVRPFLS